MSEEKTLDEGEAVPTAGAPRCCCLRFVSARECLAERYSTSRGYDPEDADTMSDEQCECSCHYDDLED